ncbi:hypothetical protein [Rhodoblastus sp.]|jgi:hypothetical protein|uniref:hypothetical protein n=1 Tax=Rhodoblastus sp. TaxID=1962975 RepID=UPI0025E8014F|nr:hypothetical protein [Rhodoblastus sp.]
MTAFLSSHAYLLILVSLGALELLIGKFSSPRGDANETAVDAVSLAIHLLSRPLIYGVVFGFALALTPETRDAFKD